MASEASERPGADGTMTSETGEILAGRYRLGARIGSGSTGIVYRAEDLMFSRVVAVRFLTPSLAREEDTLERLEERLHHSARMMRDDVRAISDIVDIIDLGRTDGGQLFVVTDLLSGESLADLLAREGALPWRVLRPLIVRACQIVHLSHEHGIIRQDLQTRNLYPVRDKSKTGVLRIYSPGLGVAFGARLWSGLGPAESLALARYAAPEQISAGPVDRRTDVYALGVILYECLTGQVPFADPRPAHVLAAHLLAAPPPFPPEVRRRGVPQELEAIVLRALAKGPEDRWPTVKALANAMAAIEFGPCDASGVLETDDIHDLTDLLEPAPSSTTMRIDRARLSGKPGLAPAAAVIDPAASTSEMAWREILEAAESAVGAIAVRAEDRADPSPSGSSITRTDDTAPDDSTPTMPYAPAEHSAPRWPHPAPAPTAALAPRRRAGTWAVAASLALVTAAGVSYALRPGAQPPASALVATNSSGVPAGPRATSPDPAGAHSPDAAPSPTSADAPRAAPPAAEPVSASSPDDAAQPAAPTAAASPGDPVQPALPTAAALPNSAMAPPAPPTAAVGVSAPAGSPPAGEPPTGEPAAEPAAAPAAAPTVVPVSKPAALPSAAPASKPGPRSAARPRPAEAAPAAAPAPAPAPRKQAPGASLPDRSDHTLPDPAAPSPADPS